MKKCSDVMTRNVVTCTPENSIVEAAQLMKTEDIGPVLIVDNDDSRTLVGILTDRDIVIKVIAEGQEAKTTRVGDVMSKKLVTCRTEDDVDVAMQAMAQYQLRRIPVVEENMRLAGIISQADVATRVDAPEKTGEVVKEISQENT
ncbi:MAG TPA: CBS domain-containing protein [Anaerolineales bacterium]|nr:CBS domain-containing protein [Anaerolineales bacterium]